MGRVLLVGRLAARDLRRRPAEAVLLLLAIVAATTTLTLGLVLHGVTDDPYETTRAATSGPDVVASAGPHLLGPNRTVPADRGSLDRLARAAGVVDHGGPYPLVGAGLQADGINGQRRTPRGAVVGGAAGVWAEGRDSEAASVDQPKLIEGDWVRDGGAVVEAGFADALDVGEGDRISLNGRSFRVVGVAVTAAARPYPDVCFPPFCSWFAEAIEDQQHQGRPPGGRPRDRPLAVERSPVAEPVEPGLVWLTKSDTRDLAVARASLSYVVNLRLADPAEAPAFVDAHLSTTMGEEILESWVDIRAGHARVVEEQELVMRISSWLLALLAVASIAVLVGGRMADQTRRVGLLKAVGGTPLLVAVVLLAQYTALALLGAGAGLAAGWLLTPVLADPGAGLVGAAGAPSLTVSTVGLVTAAALGVAAIATLVPAVRAARTSTVHALADAARSPRRTSWLIAVSARLPVPLLLGLRVAARRPRRIVLSAASIFIAVSGIVVVLAARAQLDQDADLVGGSDPGTEAVNEALLVLTVMMVALAAVNAVFVTWAAALDTRHSSALARALGATPNQVGTGLSAAQVLPALGGAVLGIPGGLALFAVLGGGEDGVTGPSPLELLAVVPVTVLIVTALTIIPARLAARRPVAEILQSELV